MKVRWAHSKKSGFTIVELIIVIIVIGILVAVSVVAYNGVQKNAADKAMEADLDRVSGEMQRLASQNNGVYPTTLPSDITASPNVTLTLKHSGTINYYGGGGALTPVQNGVLMSQICQDLVNEGAGNGVNQGGQTNAYITGCGNWNRGSMQITGWDSKVYTTPVTATTLLNYANTFTTNDTYNKSQESVVKNFYYELVDRQTRQGGSYPITTFWDSWATSTNGGTRAEPLPTPQAQAWYCIEATYSKYSDLRWRITDSLKIQSGSC
ncbi:MAG: prepilin-type N-terminal cleavage/methylation domain-containing protein [Candidatus Microsaccharimonas sossegonensis]|uniref:Prepilin-type N-terminal cleavage/methylation domain-containing protein n=1 Tax=Candidatus Microsaccharimonas sossegonensis TaxID=2506948 RepID=A0A4Q0AHH1_9BACT|nr:MAG: prepilin-type N-terminal cleavage/methylation domain-containing protein [Candidatus Microsaccharimonas sossegonensis]